MVTKSQYRACPLMTLMTDWRWYIIDRMIDECMACGMFFHFSYKVFRKSTIVVDLCEWSVTYTAMILVPDEYNAIQVLWSWLSRCNTNDLMLKESVVWAGIWNISKSFTWSANSRTSIWLEDPEPEFPEKQNISSFVAQTLT